ncbi:MAG: c-type cytochrome [Flavobacteriales bacterium]|nr:c-type cytochrome [Flavobacteriales bacterium]
MNGDYNTMFWLLAMTAVISFIGIIASANSLRNLVRSDFFIDKLKEAKDSRAAKTIALLILSAMPGVLMAQTEGGTTEQFQFFDIGFNEVLAMAVINIVFIGVIWFLRRTIKDMMDIIIPEEEKAAAPEEEFVSKVSHILTDRVAIEEEHTILMDHDYDGIQELDNNLPPWWKWGFYLTIFVGIVYLFNFHVLKTGDLQIAEYEKDMAKAHEEVQAYLVSLALNVDENTVVQLTDAASLESGKKIFNANCAQCHLEDGGGSVGPNMTDDYFIYGPDIKTVFSTIKYGAKNGMTSWKEKLTPVEIQEVASYLRTLHGTTPAVAKEPQGELMEFILIEGESEGEESATDSTVVAVK